MGGDIPRGHGSGEHTGVNATLACEAIDASNSPVLECLPCSNTLTADGEIVLSASEVRRLIEFFLLLDRWDRIGTTVAAQTADPETTAA